MQRESYRVKPQSIKSINDICEQYLLNNGIMPKITTPVCTELLLDSLFKNFKTKYCLIETPNLNEEASYDALKNEIEIPLNTYLKALKGDGRSRFTIAHEAGHVLLHRDQLIGKSFTVHRTGTFPIYEEGEWQAHCAAGSLLCPKSFLIEIKEKSKYGLQIQDIIDICQMSYTAAEIRRKQLGI